MNRKEKQDDEASTEEHGAPSPPEDMDHIDAWLSQEADGMSACSFRD